MSTFRPWRVLHLKGSDYEIGWQHAEQLGAEIHEGMLGFYRQAAARVIAPGSWSESVFHALVVGPWLRNTPPRVRDRLAGMGDGGGLSPREMRLALLLPDLAPVVQGALRRVLPKRFLSVGAPMGCSSFISKGERFLIGRNLDFPGVGYWERFPVVQCMQPPGALKSISFTTSGVPLGGITGINEAQIYVAIHQHYTHRFSFSGNPCFVWGEKILNEARSLADAREILSRAKLSTGWSFILADGKTREGMVWEATPERHGICDFDADGLLAHSNYFQTAGCREQEYATSARMIWDNRARRQRLLDCVQAAGPGLTPGEACVALSDHTDPYWNEEKVANRIVSIGLNVQSLVLDPERMEAWLGEGDTPIHSRQYRKIDLGKVLAGGEGLQSETLPTAPYATAGLAKAKEEFTWAFSHWLDGDAAASVKRVQASVAACETPESAQTLGLCYLRARDWTNAQIWLGRAVEGIERRARERGKKLPPEYFEMRLFQGRLEDLRGRRAEAQMHYRFIEGSPDLEDANVRALAGRARPYQARELSRVSPFSGYVALF